MNVIITQISAKKVIKLFKDHAVEFIVKGYTQLDNKNIVDPENSDVLTPEQNQISLRAVNLVKEKQCIKIKGRTCAESSTQRGTYPGNTHHQQIYP